MIKKMRARPAAICCTSGTAHNAAAQGSCRSSRRKRGTAAAGLIAPRLLWPRRRFKVRYGCPRGGNGALGAGPERSRLNGSLVLRYQWPDSLRAWDAGAVSRSQQDARVPRAQRQGALRGLELRRASPGLGVLRQDGQRFPAGKGPVGELLGPGPGRGEVLWQREVWC